jgi:histidine ammonia-lyase/phenylalanine ammonia-lyase
MLLEQQRTLDIDGQSLTIEDVVWCARAGGNGSLPPAAAAAVERTHRLKHELVDREIPIYGVTTGFGDSAHRQIAPGKAAALQDNLLRNLGAGVGPVAAPDVTRATILLRANCLAKGKSGVRTRVVRALLDLLEHDILPCIPERGSVGASGDLVPLSYIGSTLVGEAPVRYRGEVMEAAQALELAGLEPLTLEAKEGLALTNGTSFMTAFAALATHDARRLAVVADICTAMASEALLGNRGHFNAFIFEAKPHPGIVESGRLVREMLADSRLAVDCEDLYEEHDLNGRGYVQLERQVQDRYSIRCAPHVVGALRDTTRWVGEWVEIEANASDDNPLFDAEGERVHSGGNFYGGHITQAMDSLKVGVANLCDLLDRQLELVVDEKFNRGLTPNLIPPFGYDDPRNGLHHGFKGMQISASSLAAEALKLSNPASVHSRSTEAHNQDKVSMGTIAARDARTIVELAEHIAAMHLIAVCQALDLRGIEQAGPYSRAVHARIRERVPYLDGDRRTDTDIAAVVDLIRRGDIDELAPAGR